MLNNFRTKIKAIYLSFYYEAIYFLHIKPTLKFLAGDNFNEINERIKLFEEGEQIVWKPIADSYGGKHFYGKIESISTTVFRIRLDDGSETIGVNPKEVYKTSELLPR